jgi:protein phosphatase
MAAIETFGLTDVGKKRKHNEDAYALDEGEGLFIVADGMGGHAAGEVAAKITVETISEFIAATRQKEEATWPFKYNHELDFNSNRLAIAIEKANERVMSAVAAQPWLKGMGTTVVAGLLNEKVLSLAHVGDSRAYLYRSGELTRLTDDHSWVHEQVSAGILTEDEAKTHPLKNVVTRALGGGPSVSPDLREMKFSPGDIFLFCSDGLTTMLSDEEIRDTVAADERRGPRGSARTRRSLQQQGQRGQHRRLRAHRHPRPRRSLEAGRNAVAPASVQNLTGRRPRTTLTKWLRHDGPTRAGRASSRDARRGSWRAFLSSRRPGPRPTARFSPGR